MGTIEFPSVLFANEFSAVNEATKLRWQQLVPYGDWPNVDGLQRVQKADAERVVATFNSIVGKVKNLSGLPFFIGHPDHKLFRERYKDDKAYGRIKALEARDDGLWAGVKFGAEGEKLIADEAFDSHSVNWHLKEDPQSKGVFRPFRLNSVGFTNFPNIQVPGFTTANEQSNNLFLAMANMRLSGAEFGEDPKEEASESPAQESAEMTIEEAQKRIENGNASLSTAKAYDLNTNADQAQSAYADARSNFQSVLNSRHSILHPLAQAGMRDIQNTASPYTRDLAMAKMRNPKAIGETLQPVL